MSVRKGVLKSFDSGDYTATVQLAGSQKVYLEDIAVARNLPAVEMALDRKVTVAFFDEHNAKEAVVVSVYTLELRLYVRRLWRLIVSVLKMADIYYSRADVTWICCCGLLLLCFWRRKGPLGYYGRANYSPLPW